MEFIGLIVRCRNEPYVTEFVHYYLKQGIDKIFIIDDHSDKHVYKDVIHNQKVKIIFDNVITDWSEQFVGCKKIYTQIRHQYEWIIVVDMDEFITTNKNNQNTIKQELETTFKHCMCIKIPWVMMSCNSIQKNPESLLKNNVYRWNHDITHINIHSNEPKFRCRYEFIEVKCIFKPAFFENIYMHHPIHPISNDIRTVESIRNTIQPLDSFYENLREKDIQEGYLLCYHYRIISVENCLNKIKYNLKYNTYKLEDLLSNDYPEIIDETIKIKSI